MSITARLSYGCITLTLLAASLLGNATASAVVFPDGYGVPPASRPAAVRLLESEFNGFEYQPSALCSGTLIAPRVVLTAAHCLSKDQRHTYTIEYQVLRGHTVTMKSAEAEYWYVHQRYSKQNFVNDIGLLVLKQAVSGVTFAKLPPSSDTELEFFTGNTLMGWGEDQNGDIPKDMAVAEVSSYTSKAERIFQGFNPRMMIAAGKLRKTEDVYSGACHGDSGGPLFASFGPATYLIGITSYSAESCNAKQPTAFTRVSAQISWIRSATKGLL